MQIWFDELAISSFKQCSIANIREAGLTSAHRALVELHRVNRILTIFFDFAL